MIEQRKDEIERKVFYRHIESIMRTLEQCEDTNIIFLMGMEMGRLHRSLSEELSKEIDPEPKFIAKADGTIEQIRDCKTCTHSKDGKSNTTEKCHDCMWVSNYASKNF